MYLCLSWWTSLVAQLIKIPLQCRRPWFDSWVGKIPWRSDRLSTSVFLVFPGGSDSKESACNAGDLGLIPGWGRSPGDGNGYPLQYACWENFMDRGAWQATVHGVTKNQTWQSQRAAPKSHFSAPRLVTTSNSLPCSDSWFPHCSYSTKLMGWPWVLKEGFQVEPLEQRLGPG